jgi:hypothetical protein
MMRTWPYGERTGCSGAQIAVSTARQRHEAETIIGVAGSAWTMQTTSNIILVRIDVPL